MNVNMMIERVIDKYNEKAMKEGVETRTAEEVYFAIAEVAYPVANAIIKNKTELTDENISILVDYFLESENFHFEAEMIGAETEVKEFAISEVRKAHERLTKVSPIVRRFVYKASTKSSPFAGVPLHVLPV